MIGFARECNRLYYLEELVGCLGKNQLKMSCYAQGPDSKNTEIWFHHLHLGRPPFPLLRHLLPSLFQNFSIGDFHCDVCQFTKSHWVSFLSTFIKSNKLFVLIHLDIWGLVKISNVTRAQWFVSFIDDCTCKTWLYLMKKNQRLVPYFLHFTKWSAHNLEKTFEELD